MSHDRLSTETGDLPFPNLNYVESLGIDETHRERFERLYSGVRDRNDPVSWRTLIIDSRTVLNVSNPEFNRPGLETFEKALSLVNTLTNGTYLKPLVPEILHSMGYSKFIPRDIERKPLDALLFNGRHLPEPLLWTLADHLSLEGKEVAVVNPVGHYNDKQTRIVAPHLMTRSVTKFAIVSSTQEMYGGNLSVLANVINTLRNPKFSEKISEVYIIIPMFGGSRGHRVGQSDETGYEILEARFNAELLATTTRTTLEHVDRALEGRIPEVSFVTVDIHNKQIPQETFRKANLNFNSAIPAPEFAQEAYLILEEKALMDLPVKVVACDAGSRERTENCAAALLQDPGNKSKQIDVIYLEKERENGVVKKVEFTEAKRFFLEGNNIFLSPLELPSPSNPSTEDCIVFVSDDMVDRGGTNESNFGLLSRVFPNARLKISAATHPVLSKGLDALDRIPADIFLLGNTLTPEGLDEHPKVRIVDMAPAIARQIYS